MVEISAKKRTGIEELLEMVLLQAELMEIKANPNKPARGHVIEAKLDKGRGPVATILIQEGTLKTGDAYVCGVNFGRVRNMFNDRGQRLDEAGPSFPIEVLGLSGVPNAGDDFIALADERQAKLVAENRLLKLREKELTRTSKVTLESLFEQIQEGEIKELKVIVKSDVHGSQEAIGEALMKLSTPEVKVNIIHNATGAVTETDVMLASASNAIVIGFNIRAESKVAELAEQEHVDMRYYDVIYQLLSDVRGRHGRHARTGIPGKRHGPGRGAPDLPRSQNRDDRRMLGSRRPHRTRAPRSGYSGTRWSCTTGRSAPSDDSKTTSKR